MFPKLPKEKFSIKKIFKAIKNYDSVVNELEHISKINEKRLQDIFRLQSQNKSSEDLLVLKIKEIKKLEEKIIEKEEQRRANAGKIGGLKKRINLLEEELVATKKELSDTKEMLKDAMNEEKWLRVPLPPVKAPKQKMSSKPPKMKPQTRKFMMNEFGK